MGAFEETLLGLLQVREVIKRDEEEEGVNLNF